MAKKVLALAVAGALLGGCASAPKPVVPQGSSREPINNKAEIEEFQKRTAWMREEREQRSQLTQTVQMLARQVQELKIIVAAQQHNAELQRPKALPVVVKSASPAIKKASWRRPALTQPSGKEGLVVDDGAVVFRLSHDFAQTDFEPSQSFASQLLRAARESARIIIRGRTDAKQEDEANRKVALMRAIQAKRYLVRHGIDPEKIRMFYLSAGDHLADNSTAEGRAINRRVEIEAHGMDPADHESYARLAGVIPQ